MFAFREGVIDLASTNGGICSDGNGAYALVLKGSDEAESMITMDSFRYLCRRGDSSVFQLTKASPAQRTPIRVFRSHTLTSLWAPMAGIRYDGL